MTNRALIASMLLAICGVAIRAQTMSHRDPVAALADQIADKSVRLDFDEVTGYLPALLRHLKIPVESQTLVFTRSSLQRTLVSPARPRAIYFNDTTYLAYVPGGQLEVIAVDPSNGPRFYTVDQEQDSPNPQRDAVCALCHDPASTGTMRLIMRSHFTDRDGYVFQDPRHMAELQFASTDETPFHQRWGGWYVTGTHGDQRHMGNIRAGDRVEAISDVRAYAAKMDLSQGANVTDLQALVDLRGYPTRHSDIVALMVLGHQTDVETLIGRARRAVAIPESVANVAEPLVKALLFAREARLTARVQGTSGFQQAFESRGPFDREGRSLRQFDLERRLFRYPLSYMIYSDSFNALPEPVKRYVYQRIRDVLAGTDRSRAFAALTDDDRAAIAAILKDTKLDF